jgi:hypothetical protein
MRLPKFWRDCGAWNEPVVTAGIVVGLLAWGGVGWWLGSPWLLGAAVLLGPLSGFLLGLGVVVVLCRFFVETRH